MNKKPRAFWHMMSWGAVSGTILGTLFLMFFVLFGDLSLVELFSNLFILMIPALIFGGIPGVVIGFIEAFFVKNSLADIPEPFTKEDMKNKRWVVYRSVFPIPIVFSIVLSLFFWFVGGDFTTAMIYWFIFGIPTIIASIASMYAAHRYMFRLRLWSESLDVRKSKAKNDDFQRLQDKAKNEAAFIPENNILEQSSNNEKTT